jgi:hypothetical protein
MHEQTVDWELTVFYFGLSLDILIWLKRRNVQVERILDSPIHPSARAGEEGSKNIRRILGVYNQ